MRKSRFTEQAIILMSIKTRAGIAMKASIFQGNPATASSIRIRLSANVSPSYIQ